MYLLLQKVSKRGKAIIHVPARMRFPPVVRTKILQTLIIQISKEFGGV